ncbi:MAG: four helix bundle suffix domain-containing protein [Victivallales bacterium]
MSLGFIPPNSGYKKLKSYQKSVIIYDGTIYFCNRFYWNNRRQTDQMEQAARSGKQNNAEGSMASATSKQTEIHLTNVARASLGELMEDYEDFLRINKLPIWDKNHPTAIQITELSRHSEEIYETYRSYIENESPEVSANTIRHLILQAMLMLNKQIQRLEQDFLKEGGIRERMTNARLEYRNNPSSQSSLSSMSSSPTSPLCPLCNSPMKCRTARVGANAGKSFWGCSKYPDCRGTISMEAKG